MSVCLLVIPHAAGRHPWLFPIATEECFLRHWEPAAARLSLRFVPLFGTGLTVAKEDVPMILDELRQLRTYFEQQHATASDLTLAERVDALFHELRELQTSSQEEIYIG
jgi:hypothetical protein